MRNTSSWMIIKSLLLVMIKKRVFVRKTPRKNAEYPIFGTGNSVILRTG